MSAERNFWNLYNHDFVRVAIAVPRCKVADPAFNADQTLQLAQQAHDRSAAVVLFPELGLSAYSCDDLFHQSALLDGCEQALARLLEASQDLSPVLVVGLPVRLQARLFNCAAVLHRGRLLGVVPKTYLPNYGEFYEARQFASGDDASVTQLRLAGQDAPFGAQLIFRADDLPGVALHIEICEDVWTPIPPSSFAALAGATLLLNLSASNATVGKANYRRELVAQQSARCLAAYLYASAGHGESSTDMAWDGQALIAENGAILAESARFEMASQLICADVDVGKLLHDRMRQTSFGQSARRHAAQLTGWRSVGFELGIHRDTILPLNRDWARFPYVPADPAQRDERCEEVYNIQVQALSQRLQSSGISRLVIGVSGGLDSTHALLVCARVMDRLGLPRRNILAFTMPGYATGSRTLAQARELMQVVGCSAHEIDIRPSCEQMFKDIGHPFANGQPLYDITFENVQAGERTSHLFRLANFHGGMVVGTGDLSELALGWCTYGVGDHMAHYNVNASVPKTLIRYLVRWVAETNQVGEAARDVLERVLDTEVSPELVPQDASGGDTLQRSEASVGAYELQDFNLYHTIRFGFSPRKIAFLAAHAWRAGQGGASGYDIAQIKATLRIFVQRFFGGSQFKRSCAPNSPKVGSGGSLSPRGDWRAPSDSEATPWLDDAALIPDQQAGV